MPYSPAPVPPCHWPVGDRNHLVIVEALNPIRQLYVAPFKLHEVFHAVDANHAVVTYHIFIVREKGHAVSQRDGQGDLGVLRKPGT